MVNPKFKYIMYELFCAYKLEQLSHGYFEKDSNIT